MFWENCIHGILKNPKKNYLEGIQTSEQQEWDFEYVHQKTGERRWFHIVAMGSEVNRKEEIYSGYVGPYL